MMMREAMVIMVSRQAFLASPTVRKLRYLCTCPHQGDVKSPSYAILSLLSLMKVKVGTWVCETPKTLIHMTPAPNIVPHSVCLLSFKTHPWPLKDTLPLPWINGHVEQL